MIYFLNSTNRVYKDTELNKVASLLFSNGVFNTKSPTHKDWVTGGDFLVEAPGVDMNITAKAGSASVQVTSEGILQQVFIQEDVPLSATVASNASLALRMDTVVLRVNQATITADALNAGGSNAVSLVVISGNGAGSLSDAEIAVALSGDPYVRLADIAVPFGATTISAGMLTDMRQMVKMTRSVKAGFDSVQLYELQNDPDASQLLGGEIWYNAYDGILKFFDGTSIQALQTQTYDWGYYPPNGLDDRATEFDTIYENPGETGIVQEVIWYYDNISGSDATRMVGQYFTMPDIENPFIQIKMGNPTYQQSLVFEVWAINGSGQPITEIQAPAVRSVDKSVVPKNGYVDLFLDGSLYTPGVTYLLVVKGEGISRLNTGNDADFLQGYVQASALVNDDFFKGFTSGYNGTTQISTASSLTWAAANTTRQMIMRISDRARFAINETDATGNAHEVAQPFIAKSKDIKAFRVKKSTNLGSPTGDITASLYVADDDGNTVGDVLSSYTIPEATISATLENEDLIFEITRDDLTVGAKYVVVLDADVKSDTNQYRISFAEYFRGQARRYNTVDGWVDLGGDFFYSIETTPIRKILVLGDNGLIPEHLINLEPFKKLPTLKQQGITTKNLADASVVQVIPHGLGYAPKHIRFDALMASGDYGARCFGVWDEANGQRFISDYRFTTSGAIDSGVGSAIRIYGQTSTNEYQTGTVTVDDVNINISWVLTNTPVGSAVILWEAE